MHPLFQHLPIVSSAICLLTLVLCYILTYAFHNGVIPPEVELRWLPRVLYTAKYMPESIIFATGMALTGFLHVITAYMRYFQVERRLLLLEEHQLVLFKKVRRLKYVNMLATIFAVCGSIMFCTFAFSSLIPEKYMDIIAFFAFAAFIMHMYANTALSHDLKRRSSFFNRLALSLFGTACLLVNIPLRILSPLCTSLELVSTLCQYGLFVTLMVFTGLYYYSFTAISFVLLEKPTSYV